MKVRLNVYFIEEDLYISLGKFFHIDFGYILGEDPKYMPPPIKLCKEMIYGNLLMKDSLKG